MGRSIKEIEEGIKSIFIANGTIQQVYNLIPGKTFNEQFSKVCIESLLIYVFASAAWLLEQLFDDFKAETDKKIDEGYVTSLPWYYRKALEFQKGDELAFNEKTYSFGYSSIDESKRIVKNVAVRQVTDEGVTKLKIYFSDENKQPLTSDQRTAFESYMREIAAAGTHFLFVSETPDQLRVHLHIYYDPLVLDSTGTRLLAGGKPVEETIKKYLDSLEYGGVFYASKLVDMIQASEGVKDITLDGTTWQGEQADRRRIDAESGAFELYPQDGDIIYAID